jgi:hypothetical protein
MFLFLFNVMLFTGPAQGQKLRWDVKLLVDTAGHRVYKMQAQSATVDELATEASNPRPNDKELRKGKRAAAEKRKITVTAFIMEDGREHDGDYHLVLKNLTGDKTLIGEIPDPAASKLDGFKDLRNDYEAARNYVNEKTGRPPSRISPLLSHVKVKITGIVFFDKIDHGNGHAENGAEIHPILKIESVN